MEQRTYTKCGCVGPEPSNMGRGNAREQRLIIWFERCCQSCAESRVRAEYAKHTRIDGTPLTIEEQAPLIARRLQQIARAYGDYS